VPDWASAGPNGTFGNRFDDPDATYRVLYASSQKLGCFLETLAPFRLDPKVMAELAVPDEVWTEAARHYNEPQLASLVLWIAMTNVWNRFVRSVCSLAKVLFNSGLSVFHSGGPALGTK